jgi:hypothetical protein
VYHARLLPEGIAFYNRVYELIERKPIPKADLPEAWNWLVNHTALVDTWADYMGPGVHGLWFDIRRVPNETVPAIERRKVTITHWKEGHGQWK